MNLNAAHLRAARERAHLTQQQLAARAGLSKGRVKQLEQGRSPGTRYETIFALAAALDVPFSHLCETEVHA